MTRGALIIGSGAAGLQAAIDLADSGISVHLVDSSPFLGSGGASVMPLHLFRARLLEVAKHPAVTVWTNTHVNRIEGETGQWSVELRRHPRYVDLARCTACGDCVKVCPVAVPGTDHRAIYLSDGNQPGCAVVDKLGKPPCSNTCPGGIHVQGYVALAAEGRFQEALDLIREAIPFPGICGRICTHPCEINCRRAEVDKPVAIRLLKRFLSDWELVERPGSSAPSSAGETPTSVSPIDPSGYSVAVVGAGPGGMATAHRLARLGHRVTVFEKLPVIGGMMAVGIPEYRLPRDVIAREYRHILDLGVELRLGTSIGPEGEYTLDDLFALGYHAVCLAVGAHRSHELRIPGETLSEVVQGIELLRTISLSQQLCDPHLQAELNRLLHRGKATRVAVLGGGNTAMDVSRSLRRLGLEDVRILYRRTRTEMPAMPEEVEDAEREGVVIDFLVSPVRVLGDAAGAVVGLECLRMKLGEPDASGRRRPVPIAGSEFVVDLDLVVLAIGQAPDLSLLGPDHGLAITRDERINVDGVSFMTSRPGVFACGDAVTADKMAVIEAIGMGKQTAAAIDAYLKGLQPHEVVVDAREIPIARREMSPDELAPKQRVAVPTLPMEQRLAGYAEVELGYSPEQAVLEAQRCLKCGPCSECMACVGACKPGAVIHQEHESLQTVDIGAILYADDPQSLAEWPALAGAVRADVLYAAPDDPLAGSAAAAQAMFELCAERQARPAPQITAGETASAADRRTGIFVCECGGYISDVVDTQAVCDRSSRLPSVVYAQVLPFACSQLAAHSIELAVEDHSLSRVVLAACSCCSIDQVCYSCTYQRVRCRSHLGVFPGCQSGTPEIQAPALDVQYEFVNIREQCAWVHGGDPQAATAKATALVAAAAAKLRTPDAAAPMAARLAEVTALERSVLVLGAAPAGRAAVEALARQGIAARPLRTLPSRVERAGRRYTVTRDGASWEASALILAPARDETEPILALFGAKGRWLRPQRPDSAEAAWPGVEMHPPGVFVCEPDAEALVGFAAAARAAAWLVQADRRAESIGAVVDAARCRACGTCVDVCELGAAHLSGGEPQRASWIDPAICTGCATCAAHCPSGAISAGSVSGAQLEAMLEAALA